ncbi:MAG: hypothetical protein HIU91_11185 [Acidobacteria bacterium]|nr:hypothetical protein [Acidobacteriota bacterium]
MNENMENNRFDGRPKNPKAALQYLLEELQWQEKNGFVNMYRDDDSQVTEHLVAIIEHPAGVDPKTEQKILAACKMLKKAVETKLGSWDGQP